MIRDVAIGATAGNANYDYTVPVGRKAYISMAKITYVADASVANRQLVIGVCTGGGATKSASALAAAITASLTRSVIFYTSGVAAWTPSASFDGGTYLQSVPFQPFWALGGEIIRIKSITGVAGDSFSGIMQIDEVAA